MGLDPPNATRPEDAAGQNDGARAAQPARPTPVNLIAECADFMAPKTIFRERDGRDLDCGRPLALPYVSLTGSMSDLPAPARSFEVRLHAAGAKMGYLRSGRRVGRSTQPERRSP